MNDKNAIQMFEEAGFASIEVNNDESYFKDINVQWIRDKVKQKVIFDHDNHVVFVQFGTPDIIPIITKRLEELKW